MSENKRTVKSPIEQIEEMADIIANEYNKDCELLPYPCMRKFENDICTAKVPNCKSCKIARILYGKGYTQLEKDELLAWWADAYNTLNSKWEKQYYEQQMDLIQKMYTEIKTRCLKGGIYPVFLNNVLNKVADKLTKEVKQNCGRTDNKDDMC